MILDGVTVATELRMEQTQIISDFTGRPPCLAVVLVGEDPASQVYVSIKKRECTRMGIKSLSHHLSAHTTQAELLDLIDQLNRNPHVDGILVQLPLPAQIDATAVIHAIDPNKDIDGFHPVNMGKLLIGATDGFVPCTPLGVKVLLQRKGIETNGKHAVIIGRSNIVGKPLAALLMQRGAGANATVTIAHSGTKHLKELCRTADILITALGQPRFLGPDMVKEGAVVVDVGINRVEDPSAAKGYRLVGDVDFAAVKDRCSAITPVPGGVGPLTIAMLIQNTLTSYCRREHLCTNS